MTRAPQIPAAARGDRSIVPAIAARSRADLRRILVAAAPPVVVLLVQLLAFPLPVGPWLSGAVLGVVGALGAVGLSLTWRSNRVVNFAQGDLGAFPATLAVLLVTLSGLPWLLGVGVGLVVAVAVGVLADVLVIRRFARSPRLLLTVATLGLAQVLAFGSLLLPRAWGEGPAIRRIPPPFDATLEAGGVTFNANDLIAVVVAPLLLAAVAVVLRRTDTGVGVRAAAERIDRAASLGVPVMRLETRVWVLATVLSFASVILAAGISSLPFGVALGLTVLARALAAVVMGRMTRLVTIGATAVALGVLESAVRWNTGDTAAMAPLLAVFVLGSLLLYRTGATRAEREESSWQIGAGAHRLPSALARVPAVRVVRALLWVALAVVVVAGPTLMGTNGQLKAGVVAAFALVGVSVVVLTGWAGQVSLGQMAFVGLGGAIATVGIVDWNFDPFVALLAGGLLGAGAAVLVGLPALRMRGLFLAVVTLTLGIATSEWLLSNRVADWIPVGTFERPALFHRIALDSPLRLYWFALGVLALALVALAGLRRSRTGRVLVAMRDNESNVAAFGISPVAAKLTAFAVSGFVAAMSGVVIVIQQAAFREKSFLPEESISVLVATVVGGLGSLTGGVIGAVVQRGAQWLLPSPWSIFATGAGALIVLLIAPSGVAGWLLSQRDRLARAVAGGSGPSARPAAPAGPAERPGSGAEPERPAAVPGPAGVGVPLAAAVGTGEPTAGRDGPTGADGAADEPVATAVAEGEPALLRVRALVAGYGDLAVVQGVDLDVAPGEVVALVGGNGAGKTTFLRAMTGVIPQMAGTVEFDGRDLTGRSADVVAAAGITQVPGGEGVFPGLTVGENLRVGAWLLLGDEALVAERRREALEAFPALRGRLDEPAANLSGGQQQMLAMAMALMSQPKLLVIDELSLGLAPLVVSQLAAMVRSVAAAGTAVVLVEQSLNVALTMADRAVFLEHGLVRFSGPAKDLAGRDDLLAEVFLASDRVAERVARHHPGPVPVAPAGNASAAGGGQGDRGGGPVLEVVDLVRRFGGINAVSHVSFSLAEGEIVGLIGQNGAGKTTVVDMVSGYQRPDHGMVRVDGVDVTADSAVRRFARGLGRTFQGGRLFPGLTVREAVEVGLEQQLGSRGAVEAMLRLPAEADSEAAAAARATELLGVFGLAGEADRFVADLSTGTRRVVELAAAVAHQPRLLLLDEPAAGLAQPEVEAMVGLLERVRDELGCSMLLIEHDMPLVAAVSDRIVALESGSVIAQGPPAAVLSDPLVVASYLGTDAAAVARSGGAGDLIEGGAR